MSATTTVTREQWLQTAAVELNQMIAEKTALKPVKRVQISTGWPRNDRGGKVIGQCWSKKSGGGTPNIYISPLLATGPRVLPTLLHELIHAADDCESKHGGEFRAAWKALGFVGKPTSSEAGPELRKTLAAVSSELGKYPHKPVSPTAQEVTKQTTRMLKITCPQCGCFVRMTRKWLEGVGEPTCACGTEMVWDGVKP